MEHKMDKSDIPVVILCGGEGTRFREETQFKPKPLVEIGDFAILWHVMTIYSNAGFNNFILCLGYKGSLIKEYFMDYELRTRNLKLDMRSGNHEFIDDPVAADWMITFAKTGESSMTGARIKRIQDLVSSENFMLTYADGVADLDINALVEQHLASDSIGTVTGVQATSQFGELAIKDGKVTNFSEKPTVTSTINGGFFVFNKQFFDYLSADADCVFENEPLEKLSSDGELDVFVHKGFWQCMDTYKDFRYLNELWESGNAPWAS